jgi:hypothetical protein
VISTLTWARYTDFWPKPRPACPQGTSARAIRAIRRGAQGLTTVTHGQVDADDQDRCSRRSPGMPGDRTSKLVMRVRFPSPAPIFCCSQKHFDSFSGLARRPTTLSCHTRAMKTLSPCSSSCLLLGDSRSLAVYWQLRPSGRTAGISSSDGTLCMAPGPRTGLHLFQLRAWRDDATRRCAWPGHADRATTSSMSGNA